MQEVFLKIYWFHHCYPERMIHAGWLYRVAVTDRFNAQDLGFLCRDFGRGLRPAGAPSFYRVPIPSVLSVGPAQALGRTPCLEESRPFSKPGRCILAQRVAHRLFSKHRTLFVITP